MGFFDFLKRKKKAIDPKAQMLLNMIGREKSLELQAKDIAQFIGRPLPLKRLKDLVFYVKALLLVVEDKSPERVVQSILEREQGDITKHEANLIYRYFAGTEAVFYSNNSGNSIANAIVIHTATSILGIGAEYKWIEATFGPRDSGHKIISKMSISENDRSYDVIRIEDAEGSCHNIHFDITNFYGRW